MKIDTHSVFGLNPSLREASYVDRGALDDEFRRLISRQQAHIAIRGASKSGKSWLRQRVLNDPILIQCRLKNTVADIYTSALADLGVQLTVERSGSTGFKGSVSATGQMGLA